MATTRTRRLPATPHTLPKPVRDLVAQLRERDADPAYANAPVLDPYGRISISVDGETEKVDRQLGDILRAMLGRHCRLGEIHRDDNMSAWKRKGKRPGWRAMLARLESKQTDGVFAWHIDRLMRQSRDLEYLIDVADGGTVVASCFGEHRLDDADDRFILRILVAAANKASDDASRRQKRKHEAMRDAGISNGGNRAFGHQTPRPGKPIPGDVLELERDAVAWVAGALLDGAKLPAVADELNRRGVPSVTGRNWYPAMVRDMIRKPRHAGLLEVDGRIVGRAVDVEAIISEVDYRALAGMFRARSNGKPGRPAGSSGAYVLAGVLFCAVCGSPMSAMLRRACLPDADGMPYVTYRCPPSGCPSDGAANSISGHAITAWAKAQLFDVATDPRHARMVARRSAALAKIDDGIAAAARDAIALAARWGAGALELDEWEEARSALKARQRRLQTERDALVKAGAATDSTPADAAALEREWAAATVDQRRRMLLTAAPNGIGVDPPTAGVDLVDRLFVIAG